jgi:CMP-N,N'-diacetyllegionaminic acid synthase
MYKSKSVLAVIPARGGSKGIPGKNIRPLHGKPLIAWTIDAAKKSKFIDKLIVSSDSAEIIKICESFGCEAPFVRPAELAKDDTPGIEPILHAIGEIKDFDLVVLLQPTSPLRSSVDIDQAISKCIDDNAPSCVTVCEADTHPYWTYKMDDADKLVSFVSDAPVIHTRQTLPKCFQLNGAVYVAFTEFLQRHKTFISKETVAVEMPKDRSIDIDNEVDFNLSDVIIERSVHRRET